jgi:hypothetical protein
MSVWLCAELKATLAGVSLTVHLMRRGRRRRWWRGCGTQDALHHVHQHLERQVLSWALARISALSASPRIEVGVGGASGAPRGHEELAVRLGLKEAGVLPPDLLVAVPATRDQCSRWPTSSVVASPYHPRVVTRVTIPREVCKHVADCGALAPAVASIGSRVTCCHPQLCVAVGGSMGLGMAVGGSMELGGCTMRQS